MEKNLMVTGNQKKKSKTTTLIQREKKLQGKSRYILPLRS